MTLQVSGLTNLSFKLNRSLGRTRHIKSFIRGHLSEMHDATWQFTYAITRRPSRSVVDGLRAVDTGTPDYELMLSHHADYVAALREAGAKVTELEPLVDFPDSLFVEDTALCLSEGVVFLKPGPPSRFGEVSAIKPVLSDMFKEVRSIKGIGTIEAGDILVTPREVLVGRSARTNGSGIAELREILNDWGYQLREVPVPNGVLHFKSDCSLLDANTILSTARLAASNCFEDYDVILTAEGEEAAANAIRYNDDVIMAAGFPKTAKRLKQFGYRIKEINNSECSKIDGGMSCLSLRF